MNAIITPTKLKGTIRAIPSKSHAHRVLIAQMLAALTGGGKDAYAEIPTFSEDIAATKRCLAALAQAVSSGSGADPAGSACILDCGESGSTLRFLMPVAMSLCDHVVFLGSGKLPQRPISPLKEEMERHGCRFIMDGAAGTNTGGGAESANSEGIPGSSDVMSSCGAPGAVALCKSQGGAPGFDAPGANSVPGAPSEAGRGVTSRICEIRGKLTPGEYELPGNISSQFITGLLFALPILPASSSLQLTTRLESAGYVDMTLQVLRDFGIDVRPVAGADESAAGASGPDAGNASGAAAMGRPAGGEGLPAAGRGLNRYAIPGGQAYRPPGNLVIEGDWSNAAFWLACGALGGDITCSGLDMTSTQRDKEIITTLQRMGADVQITDDGIRCRGDHLTAAAVNAAQSPDLVPVTAALMAYAAGRSAIEGAQRLRIKESDRLATVRESLHNLGAIIEEREDGLLLTGQNAIRGGEIDSHNDHRIAMAAAVASCGCTDTVTIHGAEAVRKSYPAFFDDFAALGGKVKLEGERSQSL